MSRSSNTQTYRCPDTTTTNCVQWVGGDIECLGICDGDYLTEVQIAITTKLCELVGDVDMSTVIIPTCFTQAWGSQDETILNLLQFILDTACDQQGQIDSLPTTNDPVITLEYNCCSDDNCFTGVTVKISEHLQQILDCLCQTKQDILTLEATVNTLKTTVTNLQTTVTTQGNSLATAIENITNLTIRMGNVENKTDCLPDC